MIMELNGIKDRFHQNGLKPTNTWKIFLLLMQLTKNITKILSVYLTKCVKKNFIGRT